MKNILALTFIFIAVFIPVRGVMAQRHVVHADIPFDFVVGDKSLPPGTYEFAPSFDGAIRIQSANNTRIAAQAYTVRNDEGSTNACRLVFAAYGGRYFMHKIRCDAAAMNVSLIPSRKEQQLRKALAAVRDSNDIVVAVKQ
jgi:hypothetical protein